MADNKAGMLCQGFKLALLSAMILVGGYGLYRYERTRLVELRYQQEIAEQKERNRQLQEFIKRLTSERRVAEIVVMGQTKKAGAVESTTLLFVEALKDGARLPPRFFTIKGDKAHIDALVRAAIDYRADYYLEPGARGNATPGPGGLWVRPTFEDRDRLGQLLTDANVAGVSARYPDTTITDLPGRTDAWWLIPYRYRRPLMDGTPSTDHAHEICTEEHPPLNPRWRQPHCAICGELVIPTLLPHAAVELAGTLSDDELESWEAWRAANLPDGE
jgi:hypothetical protein